MITETLQQISCGISTKSEITREHAAPRGRAPRACSRTDPTDTTHHLGQPALAFTWTKFGSVRREVVDPRVQEGAMADQVVGLVWLARALAGGDRLRPAGPGVRGLDRLEDDERVVLGG